MKHITITEPAILVRIAKLYSPRMSAQALYEATRGVWRIGQRRESVHFAIAVAEGIVREVFMVGAWYAAGTTTYHTRSPSAVQIPGRWEFVGKLASDNLRSRYVGQSVAHYFRKGGANPITYVNV